MCYIWILEYVFDNTITYVRFENNPVHNMIINLFTNALPVVYLMFLSYAAWKMVDNLGIRSMICVSHDI